MNWLDVVLVLIIGFCVFSSFRKGLVRQALGMVTVVAALLAGFWLYSTGGSYFESWTSSRQVADFLGFVLVFVGVLVLGGLVGFVMGKFLKVTGLSVVDRLMGAVIGLVEGGLVSVALLMAMMAFSTGDHPPSAVVHSRVAPYVLVASRGAAALAPHGLKTGFRTRYSQVKAVWARTVEKGTGGVNEAQQENK